MCAEVAVSLFLAAVENELGHDVRFLFHGEFKIDLLLVRADVQTLPDIGHISAAVLLEHALHETVRGAGDGELYAVLGVLVQRNDAVEHLYRVGLGTDAADLECELAALGGQCAVAAGLLVGAPVSGAIVECGIADQVFSRYRKCSRRYSGSHQHAGSQACSDSLECFHCDYPSRNK